MSDLRFHDVTKHYGEILVLEGVSATLSQGITGILGPNGTGKTTLIRILAGLLPADSGEFFLDDSRIHLEKQSWRERIGYLPQSPGLYGRMTVYEFLDYMLLLSAWKRRTDRRKRIEEVSTALNLHHHLDIPIGNLSGGIKQRAAIAQALIHSPDVIFLDEPTNNLDAEERQRFHEYVFGISTTKITLFIGHIVNELPSICRNVMVLRSGRIIFHDSPHKLISLADGVVRQATVTRDDFERSLKGTLRLVGAQQDEDNVTIRFDSRQGNVEGSLLVTPTLEEAYKILLHS